MPLLLLWNLSFALAFVHWDWWILPSPCQKARLCIILGSLIDFTYWKFISCFSSSHQAFLKLAPYSWVILKIFPSQVFNTYGSLGNAALLHRYGFTEPNNPFDIVNIDLELVLKWGCSLFSNRYCRARLSLWRRLDYSGCVSENSEYFEITFDGEPQTELLTLLYIMLLPEDACHKLDISICMADKVNGCVGIILSEKHDITWDRSSEISKDLLLTEKVCSALLALADVRESCYGSKSINDDVEALKRCCMKERKLYHSLVLRISERTILEKLRTYATVGAQTFQTAKKKRMKRHWGEKIHLVMLFMEISSVPFACFCLSHHS